MSFILLTRPAPTCPENVTHYRAGDLHLYINEHVCVTTHPHYTVYHVGDLHLALPYDGPDIEAALEAAAGTFAYLVVFHDGRITVGTDAMGFYPLFYTDSGTLGFNAANFIPHLKHRLPALTINWDAWNEQLNNGDILGDKTTVNEISRLREGEKLHYTDGLLTHRAFSLDFSQETVSAEAYISENNRQLSKAVDQLLDRDNVTIPLTGGHDARRIALEATEKGLAFNAITQVTRQSLGYDHDTLVASELAALLKVKQHDVLPMPSDETIQHNMAIKDYWCGFESQNHEWAPNLLTTLETGHVIVDGIVGDITVNYHYESHTYAKTTDALAAQLTDTTHYPLSIKDNRYATTQEELGRYPEGTNQLELFKIFNHTRRNIGHWYSLFLLNGHKVVLPYAHLPFFKQSLTLAPEARGTGLFQRACMAQRRPEVANLHSTRDGFDAAYWQAQGAAPADTGTVHYPPHVAKPKHATLSRIKGSLKDTLLSRVAYPLLPQALFAKRDWYFGPLNRLALFQEWLATDESDVPLLFQGEPPFIKRIATRIHTNQRSAS